MFLARGRSTSMEQPELRRGERSLDLSTMDANDPFSRKNLASIRSLITNPSTSESTISSVLETLTSSLSFTRDPLLIHHILKLFSDLASNHKRVSHLVFDSVRSYLLLSTEPTRPAAEALDVLASIAERDSDLFSAIEELDDRFFVSLCFGPSASVRTWLLKNAERFRVRPYLLFTVFLGFTKDPYPYVREAALDGLAGLSESAVFEDIDMIEGCYCRAVELLRDLEDYVRAAAVRVVSAWGAMLVAASYPEEKQLFCSDEVFIKLCSMTRDMNMKVRVQAFDALGQIKMVSEDVLLQSMSKRVLCIFKEKKSLGQCSAQNFEISVQDAAGVFVHGVEDEFYEVRKSACNSLRWMTTLSIGFAGEALNLLMDVLNDDSIVVCLQALETMHYMAISDRLKVQEAHMHMFLGTLVNNNEHVRSTIGKILKEVKLPDLEMFRLSINGLLETLDLYPQDEACVFSVLFQMGRNHGKFVNSIIKEVSQQIEPTSEGKLGFDNVRVAALLVLAISAPLACDHMCSIPARIFSYAVTFLGRISCALADVMDQKALLTYFLQRSNSTGYSGTEHGSCSNKQAPSSLILKATGTNCHNSELTGSVKTPLVQNRDNSEIQLLITKEPMEVCASTIEDQGKGCDDTTESLKLILSKVKDIWPLIQSGQMNAALLTLRLCKEVLATFPSQPLGSDGGLAFTLQYLKIVKLLAKVWKHFLPGKFLATCGVGELNLILGELERKVRELRSSFVGFSKEEELHILELTFLTFTLRLSEGRGFGNLAHWRMLSSTVSYVESLLRQEPIQPSNFVMNVSKLLSNIGTSVDEALFSQSQFRNLLLLFSLNQFAFSGKMEHVRAEVVILDNDYEHPLPFVPGLPVGIPCKITLRNVSRKDKVWARITLDGHTSQFVFLDFTLFGGSDMVRELTYTVPFYRTPKANSFTAKMCIGLECWFEDNIYTVKNYGGPQRELTYICEEKEVYLQRPTKTK